MHSKCSFLIGHLETSDNLLPALHAAIERTSLSMVRRSFWRANTAALNECWQVSSNCRNHGPSQGQNLIL